MSLGGVCVLRVTGATEARRCGSGLSGPHSRPRLQTSAPRPAPAPAPAVSFPTWHAGPRGLCSPPGTLAGGRQHCGSSRCPGPGSACPCSGPAASCRAPCVTPRWQPWCCREVSVARISSLVRGTWALRDGWRPRVRVEVAVEQVQGTRCWRLPAVRAGGGVVGGILQPVGGPSSLHPGSLHPAAFTQAGPAGGQAWRKVGHVWATLTLRSPRVIWAEVSGGS